MRQILALATLFVCTALVSSRFRPVLPLKDQIGIGRIVGGEVAEMNEFPWQVSLRSLGAVGATHFCGGSIIDANWVVTAAHCCSGQSSLTMHVVAGGIELNTNEGVEQRADVDEIIMHPDYSSSRLTNDICLLKLSQSLEWTDAVKPTTLPEQNEETDEGTDVIVTGWGTLSSGAISLPNKLHKVTVPVISDENCGQDYAESGYDIADSMICAGLPQGGKDSCQGDSGGPFIHAETKTLLGIVSWGIGCAEPGYPGVYTQVSYYVDWISQSMAKY